ncbi:GntR family transcriptional regulator [Bengtsoniella intestinalis]|uniref:GntR family transcriptional regulator n=1 Tax=Bengtsoniella intestinalis TaxID=3073143 RepID=UPI00391F098F
MSTQTSSSKSIRAELLGAMRTGPYASGDRLPRESVLAERMNISRTQLRDILASLEREGFITRRHGVGTIINRHILEVDTRMDIEVEFLDMIRQNGFKPDVAFVRVADGVADQEIAKQLGILEGAPVIRISRLCTADGKPAIYCEDVIDKTLAKGNYTINDFRLPVFHFLQQYCGVSAYMDLANISPVVANDNLAEIFAIPVGTPLLNVKEVDFDIDGHPVFCSNEYFVNDFFAHSIMRKKL